MKQPYIKKIDNIAGFNIWIVNGTFIRNNIDEQFNNFGQYYRFNFIPKNEFWIDKESSPGEEKYFIDHMLIENKLMSKGKSYNEAIEKADKIEKRERKKSELIIRMENKPKEEIRNSIHKKLLKEYGNGLKIWIVNGELVRDIFFIDFTEGGHDKVYPFIPEKEIWIDDDTNPRERKFVILHEVYERIWMSKGLTYDPAHNKASKLEYSFRKNPLGIDLKIKQLINSIN